MVFNIEADIYGTHYVNPIDYFAQSDGRWVKSGAVNQGLQSMLAAFIAATTLLSY